jgi:uncharacterized iron-regulated membrane protein
VTDQLDLLLESVREEEPNDDAFVQRVMADVRADETRRAGRRRMRRPMVIGISAAIVVTGGAVAAVVGTNPRTEEAQATKRPAIVISSQEPGEESARPRATQARPADDAEPASTQAPTGAGYATDHSSFIVDKETGLMLQTDAYTNEFTASKPQRVTLTLENTGSYPITMSASEGCALQVMAYGAEGPAPDTALLTDPDGKFEWVCAGSDADPRLQAGNESWVLAPGERRTADAFLTLPQTGEWKVSGMCRCDFKQVKPTPIQTTDPLTDLTNRALPSPLLPEQPDGSNLVTPAIGVRAN